MPYRNAVIAFFAKRSNRDSLTLTEAVLGGLALNALVLIASVSLTAQGSWVWGLIAVLSVPGLLFRISDLVWLTCTEDGRSATTPQPSLDVADGPR